MFSSSYPSLEAFYAADWRRRHSRERDVGLLWRDNGHSAFRAAWVQETGELYLFTLGDPDDGGGTVDVLEHRFGLREVELTFAGYREVSGRPGSLFWFLDRAGGGTLARAA
jgi:hypothetical protein